MTKQQNDCFMELALAASFIPLEDNFHSRFVCVSVYNMFSSFYILRCLIPFAFDVWFPLGTGGTSDGFV